MCDITFLFRSSVTLTWDAPERNGGSRIIGYIVESCVEGLNEWKKQSTGIGPLRTTTATINSLSKQLVYMLRVSAYNEIGTGKAGKVTGCVKPEDILEDVEITPDGNCGEDVIEIKAGSTLKLAATVKGKPRPKIKWSKLVGFPVYIVTA